MRVFAIVALACLGVATVNAQVRTAFPEKRGLKPTDFPRTIELADNIYGYEDLRNPGFTTVSLFVVGADGVLIADGQGSPDATRRMLGEIAKVTAKPIKWYIVGSDHGDHTAGNSVLPKDITKAALVDIMKNFCFTMDQRCSYCHVATDDLSSADFPSDEKETKKKARELLRLILASKKDVEASKQK